MIFAFQCFSKIRSKQRRNKSIFAKFTNITLNTILSQTDKFGWSDINHSEVMGKLILTIHMCPFKLPLLCSPVTNSSRIFENSQKTLLSMFPESMKAPTAKLSEIFDIENISFIANNVEMTPQKDAIQKPKVAPYLLLYHCMIFFY